MVTDHLDTFLAGYEGRFQASHGPLRPEVEKVLFAFSQCGDPNLGVTLFKCPRCKISLAVPFSCKTRICPSCIARKAEQNAAQLGERLPPVAHRHLVISLPKKMALRLRLQEDRRLFRKLARVVTRVLRKHMTANIHVHRSRRDELKKARPGIVMAQHSWGDSLGWHPHYHLALSDGVFTREGDFYTLFDWRPQELADSLRRPILRAFVRWGRLTEQAADILAGFEKERSGFSVFVGSVIPAEDRPGLERLIAYLFRSPVSFRRLEYRESTGQVRLRLKRGGFREWDNALSFLADLSLHVPRARQQVVTYAGHYANSTGNLNRDGTSTEESEPEVQATRRRYIPWNQLVARCWSVDPEKCPKCGEEMSRSRPLLDRLELTRLLKSLGQLGYPARPPPRPPPAVPEPVDPGSALEASQLVGLAVQLFSDDMNQCPPGWEDEF